MLEGGGSHIRNFRRMWNKRKKTPFLCEIGDKLSLFFMQNNEQKYKVDKFSYNLSEECKT